MSLGGDGNGKSRGWAAFDRHQRQKQAVDHDFHKASTLLQAMNSPSLSTTYDHETNKYRNRNPMLEEETCSSEGNKNPPIPVIETAFGYVPIEPEWEASQHSKAATNAFLKGNHSSAHQHSHKAQQQRLAAEALNAKAANDILSLRNSQNNVWNLDLHGLHATEAVQALKQRLHRIETQLLSNNSSFSTNRRRTVSSSSLESMEKASLRGQRPSSLHVITGVGNHSRGGQASLPAAVTGFLNENGYHYEELKPGVVTVRPKFRVL
uniref:Smr domain-containing protein n=1 Tax=Cannabis sativa TaxID=3483 RepID=A0A803PXA0_CANSA